MPFIMFSQKICFDKSGNKSKYYSEDVDIEFGSSLIVNESIKTNKASQPGSLSSQILTLLPAVIDIGFKLITSSLKDRIKKFSAEYNAQKSYLEAGSGIIPTIDFNRKIKINRSSEELTALHVSLKPIPVNELSAFVYVVDKINLGYSSAKYRGKNEVLDYSIQITPTFWTGKEMKPFELAPIVISSKEFGESTYIDNKYRSGVIPIADGSVLVQISVKIVESNPSKIKSEKVLELWNENKEDVKTIINLTLPENNGDSEN